MSAVHNGFRKLRGSVTRSHYVLKQVVLILLPIFALLAYIFSSDLMLLGVALTTSVLVLLNSFGPPKRKLFKDPDTGFIDESSLVRLLDRELLEEPSFQKTACIALTIDNFAELEAKWDKETCDHAINETAHRMHSILRSGDEIARLSKTSFGILVSSVRAPETSAVLTLCERLEEATSAPVQVDDGMLHLTISAGFCIDTRAPKRSGASMLAAANAALEEAKQNAPRAIRSFSAKTAKPVDSHFSNDVLEALREGQILPWFQPQISTDTGEITGFEALARWDHPEKGILPPTAFLPALEQANRLEELGENILNHALRALVAWDKAGVIVPSVGVNFATQELRNPSLVERIKWDVDRFELDPARLTVEILETVISEHDDDIITRNIRALGSQGFRIDLDDFGTGHASLSNIRRFGVDRIKIDRSFVADVDSDPEQQRMVAAIIGLGERLGIETLAEGVENIGEQSILSQLGCDHLQGFAVARPMPFDKTVDWIHQHQMTLGSVPALTKRAG
jgi:diguanylate cyclase (GGDEF)-like protein